MIPLSSLEITGMYCHACFCLPRERGYRAFGGTVRRETKKPGEAQSSCRLGLLLISLANLEKEKGLDNPKTNKYKSQGRGHYFGSAFTGNQLWDLGLGGASGRQVAKL